MLKKKNHKQLNKKRRVYKHQNDKIRTDHVEFNKYQTLRSEFKDGAEQLQSQKKIKEINKSSSQDG